MPPPPALKCSHSCTTALKTSDPEHLSFGRVTPRPNSSLQFSLWSGAHHSSQQWCHCSKTPSVFIGCRAKESFWRAQGKAWAHGRSYQRELVCCSLLKFISVLAVCSQTAQQRCLHSGVPPAPRVSDSLLSLPGHSVGSGE